MFGPHYRKLVLIVDFIDYTRVLVDGFKGRLSNVSRRSFPLSWLQCTKYKLDITLGEDKKSIIDKLQLANIKQLWNDSSAGRRNACIQRQQNLNDFQRFQLYFLKGQVIISTFPFLF